MNGNCKNGYQKASKTINKSLSRLFLCTQRGESKKRGRAQQASKFPLQTTQPAVLGDEQAAAFRNERERKKGTHTRTFTHTCTRGIRLFSLLSSVGESEREHGDRNVQRTTGGGETGKCSAEYARVATSDNNESCLPTGGPTVPGGLTSCREASEMIAGTGVISVTGTSPQTTKGATKKKAQTPAAVVTTQERLLHALLLLFLST